MKITLQHAVLLLLAPYTFLGCANKIERTRLSDKTLRIMLEPASIDAKNYSTLKHALVQSGKFFVVDGAKAFEAVKKEQQREHSELGQRFENRQKYAQWGKLYGVGGVVVAQLNCSENPSTENIIWGVVHLATLGIFHNRQICQQILELVDTNTGEILVSVEDEFKTDSDRYQIEWASIVSDLASEYPRYFEEIKKRQMLVDYEDSAEANAIKRNTSFEAGEK